MRNNDRFVHDIVGIGLIALGIITLVSLVAFSKAGELGAILSTMFSLMFGVFAYIVPALLILAGGILIWGKSPTQRNEVIIGSIAIWLLTMAWWDYGHHTSANQFTNVASFGGFVGAGITYCCRWLLNETTPIFYFAGIAGCVVWMTDMRLLHLLERPVQDFQAFRERFRFSRGDHQEPEANDDVPFVKPAKLPRTPKPALRLVGDEEPTVAAVPRPFVSLPPMQPVSTTQQRLNLDRLGEAIDHINKDYKLPSLELMGEAPAPIKVSDAIMSERQAVLMRTLTDFKIGANVKQVAVGPTVTRYEVELEPGILVKKIVALADNLAMSLAAMDVRIEAPIPGKAAIGIEVPNDNKQMVSLRECLDTADFANQPSKLAFVLGKDIGGEIRYADLAKMPHLLVGGSTNSGKSVCLNVLITSILYRATPREVRFVMIDPKRVELSLYEGIPHLLAPVVKDTKQAAGILRSLLQEMDKRYTIFANKGTRNIDGYNSKVEERDRMHYIVVVIDELADLMMTQGPEVETAICRLCQLARATGIHLVVATQRPSVDVVTGTIKANIPSRLAFSVATAIDSRTILDMPGADRLIGRGDMLFLAVDASKPMRIQGAYVGEKETDALVAYLKTQEEANYTMIPSETSSGFGDDGGSENSNDELFEPAVRWLVTQSDRGASTSSLQRNSRLVTRAPHG